MYLYELTPLIHNKTCRPPPLPHNCGWSQRLSPPPIPPHPARHRTRSPQGTVCVGAPQNPEAFTRLHSASNSSFWLSNVGLTLTRRRLAACYHSSGARLLHSGPGLLPVGPTNKSRRCSEVSVKVFDLEEKIWSLCSRPINMSGETWLQPPSSWHGVRCFPLTFIRPSVSTCAHLKHSLWVSCSVHHALCLD